MPAVPTQLAERIAAGQPQWPRASRVCTEMVARAAPLVTGSLEFLLDREEDRFWTRAEQLVGYVEELGADPVDALLEYTVAYLREQARFVKTGTYANADFESAFESVYDNSDVMNGFYLDGLLLTNAFWPIHSSIHEFFVEQFLSRVAPASNGLEVGFGHGLYLAEALLSADDSRGLGLDVSEHSVAYAERLIPLTGVNPDRFELRLGDVRFPLGLPDESIDWAIFAEILEHIPEPASSLAQVAAALRPGAPIFVTTVINSNAIDHLWLFESVNEVEDMIKSAGLDIVARRVLAVSDFGGQASDPTIDIAAVCVKRK